MTTRIKLSRHTSPTTLSLATSCRGLVVFEKVRWADPTRGKGRRGGLRIIYFYFESEQQIWLMTLYNKDEASDLSANEKKILKAAMEAELRARAEKRATRGACRRKS